jgi:hypothetical protein
VGGLQAQLCVQCVVSVPQVTLRRLSFRNSTGIIGFEFLIVCVMKSSGLFDITPSGTLLVNRRFEGTYHLHLQGRRISQARNQHEAGSKQSFQ